eukprot:204700-Amphidinium_carterae.1
MSHFWLSAFGSDGTIVGPECCSASAAVHRSAHSVQQVKRVLKPANAIGSPESLSWRVLQM